MVLCKQNVKYNELPLIKQPKYAIIPLVGPVWLANLGTYSRIRVVNRNYKL